MVQRVNTAEKPNVVVNRKIITEDTAHYLRIISKKKNDGTGGKCLEMSEPAGFYIMI
ncbi:hypothetical protein A3Q56_08029 [Intoshia linei]|uniref:Uncharacterized protein n=1 Tax=Intoshia linei TaxID=1819745 RepID=A0A177AQG9_9BILA|nr:hypothetical protein A3Q56_08029 [Intoshia linei]